MRKFHVLVHSLLLVTSPSLLAYPQCEQSILQQVYNQEKPFEEFNLTYDDILKLLQDIEEEKLEEISEERLERITHFIAFLAQKGMLPGEYAANVELENDIAVLFENKDNFFDYYQDYDYAYASHFSYENIAVATLLNSREDPQTAFCKSKSQKKEEERQKKQLKKEKERQKKVAKQAKKDAKKQKNNDGHHDHHHKHKNAFAKVKDFVVKHKKAIIIGAVIVVAATVLIVAVVAASSAGALTASAAGAAAGVANAPDSNGKSDPKDQQDNSSSTSCPANISPEMAVTDLKSTIDNQIISFKENIKQNQFFQPTNPSTGQQGLSWEENGRALGSLFAHDGYKNIQHQVSYYPGSSRYVPGWNQDTSVGHSEIDQKFSTDYAYLYSQRGQDIDFNTLSHQVRGESALAHGYYEQAIQDFGKAIEFNPTNPIPHLKRAVANFGLGKYDQSLFDYQQFTSQTQKTYPLSVPDFSLGFAKGLPKGMYESGRGIIVFLSDVVTHPVHTGSQMWDALKLLSDLARTEQWETLSEVLAPEVHQLIKEWETLPSDMKGELAGYAFGKYGADILIPGTLAKTVSRGVKGAQELGAAYRGLKMAEQTFLLESAASLESSAKIAEVVHLEKQISNWLGEGTKFIRNEAGDSIFLSKDGLRRVRFDFNRPYPHNNPHAHMEYKVGVNWEDSGQIYPTDVPHN